MNINLIKHFAHLHTCTLTNVRFAHLHINI